MASQIYSRYVPPTKKKSAAPLSSVDVPPSSTTFESSTSTPLATRQDASSTYSRYIPSSKKKQTVTVPLHTVPLDPPGSPSITKRKHTVLSEHHNEDGQAQNKKQKKSHTADSHATSDAQPDHGPSKGLIPASQYYKLEESCPDGNDTKGRKSKKKQKSSTERADETNILDDVESSNHEKPRKRKKNKSSGTTVDMILVESPEKTEDNGEDEDTRHKKLLKKREKSMKKAEKLAKQDGQEEMPDVPVEETIPSEAETLHDLVPLPQPEPVPEPSAPSRAASLPPWLAEPIRVSSASSSSFINMGLSQNIVNALQEKGFNEALPIQAAVLPLLLLGKSQQPGDVLVSAATGSGKTLSYVLPMMESISRSRRASIQGLIVVPTRELVAQARQVCELCASVFSKVDGYTNRPAIGTAVGNETLQADRETLMAEELLFDPAAYASSMEAANAPWESSDKPLAERELFPTEEFKSRIPGHVVNPYVNVDVLICTPGRLVEHLKSTAGFSIQSVRWLVVDEADKLLDQSFQQWLDIVMSQIHSSKRQIRDRVRKIILSATMTTDIGQLTSLKLYRPKFVVLEGSSHEMMDAHQLAIPALLLESGVKVEDDVIKPLYLIELLRRADLITNVQDRNESSSSDSDFDSESEASDTDSHSDLDSDSDSSDLKPITAISASGHTMAIERASASSSVLIFTKSNETAVRLGRLIALLCPTVSSRIGILTSTTPRQSRQRTISSFSSGKTTILVASDLVSRGLDLPNLAHVINYDVPTSLTSYVHRIGRTARAGKEGHAWTLFTTTEAGWFWREIARNEKIQRVDGAKVERVNIKKDMFDEERQKYDDALKILEKEANSRSCKQES
jgi:ATP-dependent RNA helicase DDX51/DBP6